MKDNSDHNSHFDDQFLIESIQNGNERAFEYLFKEYYLPLTRFAWRYVKCKAIAEELVQELFTILWEKREDWNTVGSIRSYLYKSVRNLALNHLKHQDVKDHFDPLWMDKKENPKIKFQDDYREQQIKDAIAKAIEELPERGKMTYKLHRYDGLTYGEIAEVMEVSVKTVESQMSRSLNTLRDRLAWLLPFLLVAITTVAI